jgi:hypothetical protein
MEFSLFVREYGVFYEIWYTLLAERTNRRYKKGPCDEIVSRRYCLSYGLRRCIVQRKASKLIQNKSAMESDQCHLHGRVENIMYFTKIYTVYIQKEQISGTRKRPCHAEIFLTKCLAWVRALGLILCKEDPSDWYKN